MTESGSSKKLGTADTQRVMKLLPHRFPFLMVDRIIDMDRDESAVGIKSVSMNEPFFQGHFPGVPVMPGVLIIEALAQAGAVLFLRDMEDRDRRLVYFTGIDEARFRRTVVPGDQLRLTLEVVNLRARAARRPSL